MRKIRRDLRFAHVCKRFGCKNKDIPTMKYASEAFCGLCGRLMEQV